MYVCIYIYTHVSNPLYVYTYTDIDGWIDRLVGGFTDCCRLVYATPKP